MFLHKIGADQKGHSGRKLIHHLLGTYDILNEWKCNQNICMAGGIHSIYGTNIFQSVTVDENSRAMVQDLFGYCSENLAWLFGTLDRPRAIENGIGIDRRQKKSVSIDKDTLISLRLIEAANLLEQGGDLSGWPNIQNTLQNHLSK